MSLELTNKQLAEIFKPDMLKLTPGWLITWYLENELVPYGVYMEGDFDEEFLEGLIYLN